MTKHYLLLLTISFSLFISGCKESVTGSSEPPAEIPTTRLLSETVEWEASFPEGKQKQKFFYDEKDRLIKMEFSHTEITGSFFNTYYMDFIYDNDRLVRTELYVWSFASEEWFISGMREFSYNADGYIDEETFQNINERTGEVVTTMYTYEYDKFGQIIAKNVSDGSWYEYIYDDSGNMIRSKSFRSNGEHWLNSDQEFHESWNPLGRFPHSGISGIFMPDKYSNHMMISFKNYQPGSAPASQGTAMVEMDEDGFPVRREFTFWNTVDEDNKMTFITEFEYE